MSLATASAPGRGINHIHTYTWSATPPYTRWVTHQGAAQPVSYGTRERPFLLTEDLGAGPVPTALYTAVTYPAAPGVPNERGRAKQALQVLQARAQRRLLRADATCAAQHQQYHQPC